MHSSVNIEVGKGALHNTSVADSSAQDDLDMQRLGKKQELKVSQFGE